MNKKVLLFLNLAYQLNTLVADQCTEAGYQFRSPFYPGKSCEDIYNKNPQARSVPGYYWITDGPNMVYCGMNYSGLSCKDIYNIYPDTHNKSGYYRINSNQWMYCNMTHTVSGFMAMCDGIEGGWTQIAYFNISAGDECPTGWMKDTLSNVSFCRPPGNNPAGYSCYSVYFPTNGTSYQSVCGRARGYQKGQGWGFWGSTTSSGQNINGSYCDGISITHGRMRHHIWTYAVGYYDDPTAVYDCPCTNDISGINSPSYVNDNYYCESGTTAVPTKEQYYFSDPLWDGSGCSASSDCCSDSNLPWFHRRLSDRTEDDIEARICLSYGSFTTGGVLVEQMELYIQ